MSSSSSSIEVEQSNSSQRSESSSVPSIPDSQMTESIYSEQMDRRDTLMREPSILMKQSFNSDRTDSDQMKAVMAEAIAAKIQKEAREHEGHIQENTEDPHPQMEGQSQIEDPEPIKKGWEKEKPLGQKVHYSESSISRADPEEFSVEPSEAIAHKQCKCLLF